MDNESDDASPWVEVISQRSKNVKLNLYLDLNDRNVRGLNGPQKNSKVQALIRAHCPDFICVSKTKKSEVNITQLEAMTLGMASSGTGSLPTTQLVVFWRESRRII